MKKVCIVVATLFTAKAFLLDPIAQLSRKYDLTVVANGDDEKLFGEARVTLLCVPIQRKIAPFADLRALLSLYRVFQKNNFDAVHSFTPKAGLLAMLAGFAARVPVRIHTFTGQVWATKKSASRLALKTLDRVMAAAATHVLVDSPSQRDFLRQEGVLSPVQGELLGKGSVSGVDPGRFRADATLRAAARSELRIPADAIVYVFVGRLARDKGVLDLARAFARVAAAHGNSYLLLVGPDEEALSRPIAKACGDAASRVRLIGMSDEPERHIAAADVFCLPSYREGFGAVVIEAAAAGLPAIGSRIYGIVDAIEDGKTGLLVEVGDVSSLAQAMLRLAEDANLRQALGDAARARALRDFSKESLTSALLAFYERILPRAKEVSSTTVAPGL